MQLYFLRRKIKPHLKFLMSMDCIVYSKKMVIIWAYNKPIFMVYEKRKFLSGKKHFQLVKLEINGPIR